LSPAFALVALVLAVSSGPRAVPASGPARDRAVAALHGRAERATPGSAEAASVASGLEEIAAVYLAEGHTGRASELLSEAYALDEDNGLVLAELTLCYLRVEDFDAARFYLRRAEERVPRAPPEIYGVLGDVYFGLHRLDDAIVAWDEFVRLGGTDPGILARLARARDELAVSRGQRSETLDDFTIYADPGVGEDLVRAAGADLERAYAEQSEAFHRTLPGRQVVVLYSGRAFFSLVSVPDWSSGLFDGKIRISVDPGGTPPPALAGVLAHELAHAMLRRVSGDRLPAWFHEGLAQWSEGRRIPVREIRSAVGSAPARSLVALDGALSGRLARGAARAAYAQALSLVEYLVAVRGAGAIGCVLEAVAERGVGFGEALSSEADLSEAELFGDWRRWAGIGPTSGVRSGS
jgi:tetratricopeptide (TPR) repeat protein